MITFIVPYLLFTQVALVDLNVEVGEASKDALDKQFGAQNNIFIACDVSKEEQLKGIERNLFCLLSPFYPVKKQNTTYTQHNQLGGRGEVRITSCTVMILEDFLHLILVSVIPGGFTNLQV